MLTGTEKQIKFAEKVKSYVIFQLSTIDEASAVVKAIEKVKKAEIILDAFVDMFKAKNVKTKTLEFLTWGKKEKYTQKDIMSIKNRGITIDEVADVEFEGYEKGEVKKEESTEVKTVAAVEVKTVTEKQINYVKELVSKNYSNKEYLKMVLTRNGMRIEMIDNIANLSSSSASQLIDVLLNNKPKASSSAPNYFTAKYDTYDCETGEKISTSELVWKDSEGIHRADNW